MAPMTANRTVRPCSRLASKRSWPYSFDLDEVFPFRGTALQPEFSLARFIGGGTPANASSAGLAETRRVQDRLRRFLRPMRAAARSSGASRRPADRAEPYADGNISTGADVTPCERAGIVSADRCEHHPHHPPAAIDADVEADR